MQIQITVDTEKDAGRGGQLTAIANILGSDLVAAAPVKLTPPEVNTPKPLQKVEKSTKPAATKAKKAEPVEDDAPTLAQLQVKAKEVVKAGRREEYKAALARFDAAKLAEVSEESYAALDATLDEILGV